MGKSKASRKASNRPLEHRPGRVHTSATALILATGKVEVGGHVAIPVLEHNFLRAIDAYRRKYRSTTKLAREHDRIDKRVNRDLHRRPAMAEHK